MYEKNRKFPFLLTAISLYYLLSFAWCFVVLLSSFCTQTLVVFPSLSLTAKFQAIISMFVYEFWVPVCTFEILIFRSKTLRCILWRMKLCFFALLPPSFWRADYWNQFQFFNSSELFCRCANVRQTSCKTLCRLAGNRTHFMHDDVCWHFHRDVLCLLRWVIEVTKEKGKMNSKLERIWIWAELWVFEESGRSFQPKIYSIIKRYTRS